MQGLVDDRGRAAASTSTRRALWKGETNQIGAEPGFPTGLLITLDRSSGSGVRSQLESELREAVSSAASRRERSFHPSRTLATELGIARSVVVEAYSQLVAEGYLEATQGAGTRVGRFPLRRSPSGRAVPQG